MGLHVWTENRWGDSILRAGGVWADAAAPGLLRRWAGCVWLLEAAEDAAGEAHRLAGGAEPEGIGVEEEEEDHDVRHHGHVDEQDDSSVVEVPDALHAADGVGCAGEGDEQRDEDERVGAVVGEVREPGGDEEADENEQAGAAQGAAAWVEDGRKLYGHAGAGPFQLPVVLGYRADCLLPALLRVPD